MPTPPRILAVDAAARFGWAHGIPGQMPRSGAQYFAKSGAGASYPNVMAGAVRWITAFLQANPTDFVCIERAIPDSMLENETNFETSEMKNGLIGVLVGMSRVMGVTNAGLVIAGEPNEHRIWLSTIRSKFLPKRPKGVDAKPLIRQKCIDLGWVTRDEALADKGFDRTDALAIWYCACVLIDPKNAPPVDPLFIAAERRKREAEALAQRYADPATTERF